MEDNNKRKRSKNNIKLNFLLALVTVLIVLSGVGVYYCKNFYELQKQENNINEGYEEDDIEKIEEVRGFFLCYSQIEEYGIDISWWRGGGNKYDNILNESINLLRKYDEIRLDDDKTLTYDKQNRNIKISQNAFTLDTVFSVDIYSSSKNRDSILSVTKTEKGTWAKVDTGIPKYVLYHLGNQVDEIEINDVSGLLYMVDLKDVTVGNTYKNDTKYYLFKNYQSKEYYDHYYIYIIEKKEWKKISSIKEIELTSNYISFIDKENNFYVYCLEHNSEVFVKELQEQEKLHLYYSTEIFVPNSIDEDLIQKLFVNHEYCE